MGRAIRVLVVEDSEDDTLLLLRELERGGYEPAHRRVETAESLSAALDEGGWDIVLSDYRMPVFDAPSALALVQGRGIDLPFVIVSGTVGEAAAVAAMRAGARDYLMKGAYTRLVPVVEREIREAALRLERRQFEAQLLASDRMASLGALAAGVGHEINNPLTALIASLEFAVQDLGALASACGESDEVRSLAREIEASLADAREAADRIRQIGLPSCGIDGP